MRDYFVIYRNLNDSDLMDCMNFSDWCHTSKYLISFGEPGFISSTTVFSRWCAEITLHVRKNKHLDRLYGN